MKYEQAVNAGIQAVAALDGAQWELGKLASEVEPRYGESTLERFAGDIGVVYKTLLLHKQVYAAWAKQNFDPGRNFPESYSVARVLAPREDREHLLELAQQKAAERGIPHVTKAIAKELTVRGKVRETESKHADLVLVNLHLAAEYVAKALIEARETVADDQRIIGGCNYLDEIDSKSEELRAMLVGVFA